LNERKSDLSRDYNRKEDEGREGKGRGRKGRRRKEEGNEASKE